MNEVAADFFPLITLSPTVSESHHSTFFLCEFGYSRYLIEVESYSIYPLVSSFFH